MRVSTRGRYFVHLGKIWVVCCRDSVERAISVDSRARGISMSCDLVGLQGILEVFIDKNPLLFVKLMKRLPVDGHK